MNCIYKTILKYNQEVNQFKIEIGVWSAWLELKSNDSTSSNQNQGFNNIKELGKRDLCTIETNDESWLEDVTGDWGIKARLDYLTDFVEYKDESLIDKKFLVLNDIVHHQETSNVTKIGNINFSKCIKSTDTSAVNIELSTIAKSDCCYENDKGHTTTTKKLLRNNI